MPKPNFVKESTETAQIIRVNHAGEYGAKRIYQGQIRYTKDLIDKKLLISMLQHEQVHLDYFTNQLKTRSIRPTLFLPLWHYGGYALGAISAMCGTKTAMLVTEAVENVIENHYNHQLNYLKTKTNEIELTARIDEFKQEEIEHRDIAINNKSSEAFLASFLSKCVRKVCLAAIFISKKL